MTKNTKLKLKIGAAFTGLGILMAAITIAVAPWSVFNSDSNTGIKDSRFYYTGDYDKNTKAYQSAVYEQLKKGPDSSNSDTQVNSNDQASVNSNPESTNANTGVGAAANASSVNGPSSVKSSASNNLANSTGSNAMAGITIAEADNSPYTRSNYGSGWDVSGLACNIRATILKQTSLVGVQTASNGCTVTYGSWLDPYSGTTLTGNPYLGDGTANDLDIDHIIPLKYVNSHGGYNWSASEKIAYGKSITAMNNGIYLAVSASENRKKGDSGPADYYPSNAAFYCEYSRRWRDIARTYAISLSLRDYNKIQGVLAECNIN